jgi:phosphatidylserine decarboxylase
MSERGAAEDRTVPAVTPELPGHRWRLLLSLIARLPQAALSRSFGQIADVGLPGTLRPIVLGGFARMVGIDLTEASRPLEDYESINDLFVRQLRSGVRSWPEAATAITSPVDGVVGRSGTIENGRLIQAKGRNYTAAALLDDAAEAERFRNGRFVTIYLSPRHYHRIHAPFGGTVASAWHVPGALLPVNSPAVMHVDNLFPRNERVVCPIDSAAGRIAVVAVGAYNVGRISTAFDPEWIAEDGRSVRNRGSRVPQLRRYDPPVALERGGEIMAFHLGSTVVLLFEEQVTLESLEPGAELRLGQTIAHAPG